MSTRVDVPRTDWLTTQLQNPEFLRVAAQEDAAFDFIYAIEDAMREQGLTRAKLAERLGKSRAYVTQTLRRGHNLTFKTAGELAWGCGLTFTPTVKKAAEASCWVEVEQQPMAKVLPFAAHAGRYRSPLCASADEPSIDGLYAQGMVG